MKTTHQSKRVPLIHNCVLQRLLLDIANCKKDMKELQRDWNYIKQVNLLPETKETVLVDIQNKFDELKKEMVEMVKSLKLEV